MSKLAIFGGTPVTTTPPAAPWPIYGDRERELLLSVLESREWGGYPEPNVRAAEFAEKFAAHHGAAYGICVTNGSVTLEVALTALDVEAGDEVIAPCYTWVATGACAVHVNAVPVFVDVDPDNYCIDPDQVEAAITDRTRAIIPVHLGANMADMDRMMDIADRHGIAVIEDCAHAHGGAWRGRGAGSIGDIGSFSFQSSKLMTAGEGGAVITSDNGLMQRCHSIVNCGRKEPGYDTFEGHVLGVNARISEFQAAVLIAQLERVRVDREPRPLPPSPHSREDLHRAFPRPPEVAVAHADVAHTQAPQTVDLLRHALQREESEGGGSVETVGAAVPASAQGLQGDELLPREATGDVLRGLTKGHRDLGEILDARRVYCAFA